MLVPDGAGRVHEPPATPHNCEDFRLRGDWRRPSGLTSRVVTPRAAHESRQAKSSETPDPLSAIALK